MAAGHDRSAFWFCISSWKGDDLLLRHGFLVVGLHHVQLRLLGVQLSLSLLEICVGYGQTVLLHCQVGLEEKRGQVSLGCCWWWGLGKKWVTERLVQVFLWLMTSPQGRK